eukprot:Skav223480  [mRNA]  locus=scaffold659:252448:254561:+ [translate_table: standard]
MVSRGRFSVEDLSAEWPEAVEGDPVAPSDPETRWWEETFQGEGTRSVRGEEAGLRRLSDFMDQDLAWYKETRNGLIGLRYSSKLSPWVAAGCVSPRRVAAQLQRWEMEKRRGEPSPSSAHFLSEFGWRDLESRWVELGWKNG